MVDLSSKHSHVNRVTSFCSLYCTPSPSPSHVEQLSLSDYGAKPFNVSTLHVGGLVSIRDMKKQPKEDHLVVFSSFQFVGKDSQEKSCFAIVRNATCKTVKDGIKQIEGKGT